MRVRQALGECDQKPLAFKGSQLMAESGGIDIDPDDSIAKTPDAGVRGRPLPRRANPGRADLFNLPVLASETATSEKSVEDRSQLLGALSLFHVVVRSQPDRRVTGITT